MTPAPGPTSVRLPGVIADAILDHARAERPNEACGVVIGTAHAAEGGRPLRYEPCRNELASPTRYSVHPDDLLRLTIASEDVAFWAIVHSHPGSSAVPSRTDVERAAYPDSLYLVVSLAGDGPSMRAWRIVDGAVHEVALEAG
jgi:proteasome lid subunit RPN8/RPN11